MLYFSCYWILRYLKFSEIVMLLFLMMTTLSMMPRNVWGEEIYKYTDKDGTIVITDRPLLKKILTPIQRIVIRFRIQPRRSACIGEGTMH